VPSVNVMQPIEPRLPPPPAAPSRGGEPFAELLDSAVTAHQEPSQPDARARQSDASAPTSRSKARTDSLARGETPEQPQSRMTEAKADAVEEPAEKMPEPPGEGEATQTEQASAEPAPEADGEIKESEALESAESISTPAADAATGDDALGDDALGDDTLGAAADATMVADVEAPTAKPQLATVTVIIKTDAATTPNLEVKAEAFAAPTVGADPEIAVAGDSTIKTEPAPQPSGADPKQTFTPVAPASAAPTDDAQIANALPVLPGNATNAKPAPDQATLPQASTASAAPPPLTDTGAKPATPDFQVSQQPNPQQVADAKLTNAAPPPTVDNPAPPPPAPDAAKIHANAPAPMPEPVRALASSLNSASLHAANVNEPNPVPLKGVALAMEIVSRMRDGMRRFEIRLDPPELGRIDVRLEVDRHGQATTKLTVDRPETLDLLQREARGLERALQQAGLKTDQGGLEFSLRQHAPDGLAHDQSGRSQRQPELVAGEDSEIIEAAAESYRATASARGGVDIKI
jgi:flagellar hook-length control protein FliK